MKENDLITHLANYINNNVTNNNRLEKSKEFIKMILEQTTMNKTEKLGLVEEVKAEILMDTALLSLKKYHQNTN